MQTCQGEEQMKLWQQSAPHAQLELLLERLQAVDGQLEEGAEAEHWPEMQRAVD